MLQLASLGRINLLVRWFDRTYFFLYYIFFSMAEGRECLQKNFIRSWQHRLANVHAQKLPRAPYRISAEVLAYSQSRPPNSGIRAWANCNLGYVRPRIYPCGLVVNSKALCYSRMRFYKLYRVSMYTLSYTIPLCLIPFIVLEGDLWMCMIFDYLSHVTLFRKMFEHY